VEKLILEDHVSTFNGIVNRGKIGGSEGGKAFTADIPFKKGLPVMGSPFLADIFYAKRSFKISNLAHPDNNKFSSSEP
jgi:hypothetical protein